MELKPDSELLEAQLEANAVGQAYQQAFSNEMESRRNIEIQQAGLTVAIAQRKDLQDKLRTAYARVKAAMEAEQRKQALANPVGRRQ